MSVNLERGTAQLHLIVFTAQCSHSFQSTDSLRHYNGETYYRATD